MIPADVIPDIVVGLGFTDDALVLGTALKALGSNMTERHYEAADEFLGVNEDRTAESKA